jgi:putative phosphoesterase
MRVAVLSDVHGNLPALEAVLADLPKGLDALVVAGDLVGGPQPEETTARLRELGAVMIRGNTDTAVLNYVAGRAPPAHCTHKQYALMRWSANHLSSSNLAFLAALPQEEVLTIDGVNAVRLLHGAPGHPSAGIYPDRDPEALKAALDHLAEDTLVCGHTHDPWRAVVDGRLGLNPGAVCGPLDGFVGAQYALLVCREGHRQVKLCRVGYDLQLIRQAFHDSGLLNEAGVLGALFLECLETGRNVWAEFLAEARALAQESGFGDEAAIPDDVWDRAARTSVPSTRRSWQTEN